MASHSSLGLDEETFFLAEIPHDAMGKPIMISNPPPQKKYHTELSYMYYSTPITSLAG